MDPEQIARYKAEYYEALEENPSLRELLNQHGGLVLARVGSHPPWPARFSEAGEFAKMSRYRTKKGQLCVYFFGTRNYGWVHRTNIMPFSDDYTAVRASKKYSPHMIQRAIEALQEAKVIREDTDAHHRRFFDRLMERRGEPVDMPCEICNRVDDHFSMLILCDGVGCKREFHMNCLSPPLDHVPPGDWYCPECVRDLSKQRHVPKPENKTADDYWTAAGRDGGAGDDGRVSRDDGYANSSTSAPPHAAVVVSTDAKKAKKDKVKIAKDGSLKRKLPAPPKSKSDIVADVSPANTKKPKAAAAPRSSSKPVESSPPKPSSRPSTPVQYTKKAMELSMLMNAADDDDEVNEHPSEERCLICGYGGELVVCEFYGCTKVYHQYCLGSFPFPKDEETTWYCPRHICAISGEREYVHESDGFNKSPRKYHVKRQLWKCAGCPLAIADTALPPIPKSYILSRSNRTFTCMHCSSAAPVKVALAKRIERIWSMLATNSQGMPFCGPLLPGVELPKSRKESSKYYLFKVLAKIRRLEYDDSASFARDINNVVKEALETIASRSVPLVEAAKTLKTICDEQMSIHRPKLDSLDSKISGLKALSKSKKALEEAFVNSANGDKRRWPLKWREECGPFDDRYYPRVEARSLSEWTAFITSAGLYVGIDDVDDFRGHHDDDLDQEESDFGADDVVAFNGNRLSDDEDMQRDTMTVAGSTRAELQSFPGLSLSEGTDVMLALTQLSRSTQDGPKKLGAWPESEFEDIEGRDFFLSPSISEMQQMFDQQSVLLRRALESHSALQKAWLVSKQRMLGLGGDDSGFSVGEGRLAAELRLANKNLRARLRNKDKLVDELTSEQSKLRTDVQALQNQLAEAKERAAALERASKATSREEDNGVSDGADDESTGSADPDRKSPRNPIKSNKGTAKTKPIAKVPQKVTKKPAAERSK